MFQRLPNDPFIIDMDPVLRLWAYEQWQGDHRDDATLAKNHALLLGSFTNPEAVKSMMNDNVHESSDEDFEESSRMVKEMNTRMIAEARVPKKRRKRAQIKEERKATKQATRR